MRKMIDCRNNNGVTLIGDNSSINLNLTPKPSITKVIEAKPDDEHISTEQQYILKSLVESIVDLEKKCKKIPATYQKVWVSLNRKFKVPRYILIRKDDFEAAEKYLRMWIGRLNSSASAKMNRSDWRHRKYSFIHVNLKKLGLESEFRSYLQNNFSVDSMINLSDEELEKAYSFVSRKKKIIK